MSIGIGLTIFLTYRNAIITGNLRRYTSTEDTKKDLFLYTKNIS